ncbi:MAG: type II toxin-antitoxin system HicA family toxin [Nitrospirae bacterium]|nr:MAG: type II toxin-antitoxin system HicA family toxin [Nitrospirota bacterium]
MRLPRDVSGEELVKALARVGYRPTRQTGSHIRVTCDEPNEHHVTVPRHDCLRVGTLSAIIAAVASHLQISRDELIRRLF